MDAKVIDSDTGRRWPGKKGNERLEICLLSVRFFLLTTDNTQWMGVWRDFGKRVLDCGHRLQKHGDGLRNMEDLLVVFDGEVFRVDKSPYSGQMLTRMLSLPRQVLAILEIGIYGVLLIRRDQNPPGSSNFATDCYCQRLCLLSQTSWPGSKAEYVNPWVRLQNGTRLDLTRLRKLLRPR